MSEEKKEQLAIIKGVRCGVGDRGRAWLSFSTYVSDCSAALQIVEWDAAKQVLEDADVQDVHQLNGKPCWVEVDRGMIVFLRMAKI